MLARPHSASESETPETPQPLLELEPFTRASECWKQLLLGRTPARELLEESPWVPAPFRVEGQLGHR